MPQHRILIVEDDPEMRALLVEGIDTSHEFRLTTAATCSAAQALVGREHFDIVVLDLGLPDVEGCDGVSTLRESFSGPILVLSGRSAECDVVSALEAGATDYVNKPFRFPILIARIRAQIRAAEAANSTVFKVGPYTYRATARMLVTANGSKLKLTEKESAILQYLVPS
jgi:DNA-binding response OmpR family regulator